MAESDPQQFGEYHLLEKIATGGMAEVWRAKKQGLAGFEKILVIKKVLDNLSKDEEFIRLFIDEARIAEKIRHVNIVQVFELGKVDETYFMAMEFVQGMDLSRLIARSRNMEPFPIALALFIQSEVLKALDFAHARTGEDGEALHIVHCDISPQNILVSLAGEVKITDFGISRAAFQAEGLHEVIRGKYAYMSPEQVEGKPLDGRSDIFSMGIVLYELLTGRRLFKARTRDETLDRVRRAEVPSPRSYRPEISEDLEAILLKALQRRTSDRYRTAGEMVEDIQQLMVREGHRATNNNLAVFIKDVVEMAASGPRSKLGADDAEPHNVVVLAIEAAPPPRTFATPRVGLTKLTQEWTGLIAEAGGQIWERGEGSLLAVWVAKGERADAIRDAVNAARSVRTLTQRTGYQLSAGVAPGVARLLPDTERPPEGWELSGPFYLARWMMNLSAHRGRLLVTEVSARQVDGKKSVLGRISIQGNRYINLYEVG